ncbi:MAG: hypothetical protein ACTFAK_11205 [Candidatus Electronema sp. VV]
MKKSLFPVLLAAVVLLCADQALAVPSWWTTGSAEERLDSLLIYAEYFYRYSAFLLGFFAALISATIWRG